MRQVLRASVFLSALLAAAASGVSASPTAGLEGLEELPRGEIVEQVLAQSDPSQSYALYIPTSYRPGRPSPILYALDARSRGGLVAERFRAGAEKYGYLVASSNNSASDGPTDPNVAALRAMWADTHARFSIDDRRVYAAGFSGTVRFACNAALSNPGSLAGVIGAGAGFPFGRKPEKGMPFVFFGAVGERDFNYYEVMDLAAELAALDLPHRVEVFAGAHDWMPEEVAARALGWMELQAMRRELRDKDPKLIEEMWSGDLARARALEQDGDPVEAHRLYARMAADYAGLHAPEAVAEVARKAAEMAASAAFREQRRAWEERNRRDQEYIDRAPRAFSTPILSQALAELRIRDLKKEAESADRQERLSARRRLNTVLVQTSYYLPRLFTEQGNHERAVFALSIAAEIVPESPEVWYELAAAHARRGAKKKALESLRRAVDNGWSDLPRLEGEPAFAELRQEKRYRELARQLAPGS